MWRICRTAIFTVRRSRPPSRRRPCPHRTGRHDGVVTVLKAKTALKAARSSTRHHEPQGIARILRRTDRGRQETGCAVFAAPEGDHDEDLRSIIFGHCVSVFFADVFEKHAATFKLIGVDPDNGVGDLLARIQWLRKPRSRRSRPTSRPPTRTAEPRHGQFRPRDHQPARVQRYDR